MLATRHAYGVVHAIGACFALLALAVFSSTAAAQVGYVHEISGLVSIKKTAEKAVPAKVGDKFDANTDLNTGPDGKVILKFADGEVVALGKNSALRIGRYDYPPGSPRLGNSTLELMKGEMRFVAGIIGATSRDGVRIIAGNSTLSILSPGGADFTVNVDPYPKEVGHAAVARGEIAVSTPYGEISKVAANQYVPWQPGQTPPRPMPLAAAPAVIQAQVASLWTTLVPDNKPITVASAAQTAGKLAAADRKASASTAPRLAGYVVEASAASIQSAPGSTVSAGVGATFESGATISTGTNGRIAVKFADGSLVIVGPKSVLEVGEYQFDPGSAQTGKQALVLVNGAMRVVAGDIHERNSEGLSISAGASIIDVLSPGVADDFTVVVDTSNQEVGVARVTRGEISVRTPYGPIDKIAAGESSLWGPRGSIPLATSLAVVQAAVSLQLSGLPNNLPVNVASAAAAAKAAAAAEAAQIAAKANPQNQQLQAEANAAIELANLAAEAAAKADEAVVAQTVAPTLEALPAAAAGLVVAQAPTQPTAQPTRQPIPQIAPTVTPGAGGSCTGSVC